MLNGVEVWICKIGRSTLNFDRILKCLDDFLSPSGNFQLKHHVCGLGASRENDVTC